MGKKCFNCDTSNDNNTKFCVNCGKLLDSNDGLKKFEINTEDSYPNKDDVTVIVGNSSSRDVTSAMNEVFSNSKKSELFDVKNEPVHMEIIDDLLEEESKKVEKKETVLNLEKTELSVKKEVKIEKNSAENKFSSIVKYFSYLGHSLLKPYDTYKLEEESLLEIKNSTMLSVLIVVVCTVVSLIKTMINAVRVDSILGEEVKLVWENLKYIEYVKVIFNNLFLFAAIIFGIAGIYYLAGLVIKKNPKFSKLLGVSATASVPAISSVMVLCPIVYLISWKLSFVLAIVSIVYSLSILIELVNDNIEIENHNSNIYFHLVCLSIIVVLMFGYAISVMPTASIEENILPFNYYN